MNFLLELGDIMLYKSTIFVPLKGRKYWKYFRDLGGDILYYDKIVPDLTIENFPLVFVDSKNLKKTASPWCNPRKTFRPEDVSILLFSFLEKSSNSNALVFDLSK